MADDERLQLRLLRDLVPRDLAVYRVRVRAVRRRPGPPRLGRLRERRVLGQGGDQVVHQAGQGDEGRQGVQQEDTKLAEQLEERQGTTAVRVMNHVSIVCTKT